MEKLTALVVALVLIAFMWALPGWLLYGFGGWPCVVVFAAHQLVNVLISWWKESD